ncbi:IclR family transcriptional regulator [Sphingobacterium faecium]|uniref:IclR family transcriptional regulator n=1 Tax=Sphingobacterium faecium TaxID=34087 RepID=UPI002468C74D|nr:IclR family transcriptional regulator [Sphingobacterium faecium]MDH5826323.1 IclR family transcriptional regulator [Sphingobacterium faecium]
MVQSVKRTMEILLYISQNGNMVRLQDVADHLQVEKSTAHNLIKSLLELGYVVQDELTPRYQLTDKMYMLIPPKASIHLLKQYYRPILQQITALTQETSYLSIQMGTYIRHEFKCDPERRVRISLELGKEFVLLNSAIGNVFMAYSEHLRDSIMRSLNEEESKQLAEKLDKVVQNGYAEDYERLEKELNCIAVPVFENKRIVAVIGVSGPAFRFKEEEMMKAVAIVKQFV